MHICVTDRTLGVMSLHTNYQLVRCGLGLAGAWGRVGTVFGKAAVKRTVLVTTTPNDDADQGSWHGRWHGRWP